MTRRGAAGVVGLIEGPGAGQQECRRAGAALGHKETGRRLFAGDPRIAVLLQPEAATGHYACWGRTFGVTVAGLVTVLRMDCRHANTS